MIITRQKRLEIVIAARATKAAVRSELVTGTAAATKLDAELARLDAAVLAAKAAPDDAGGA